MTINKRRSFITGIKSTKLHSKEKKFLIIDDIQLINMIDFWRSIRSPKFDATSFGHFSGTGVVDISNGFEFVVDNK